MPIATKALIEMDINYKMYVEEDKKKEIRNLYSYLYYVGQRGLIFNIKNYFIWVLSGILQSFLVFMVVIYTFEYCIITSEGYTADLWLESIVMFT